MRTITYVPGDPIPERTKGPRRINTLDDLLSIQLDPSAYLIRCVADDYLAHDVDWTPRLRNAYQMYRATAATRGYAPKLITTLDRWRWQLHRFLLKHKVII